MGGAFGAKKLLLTNGLKKRHLVFLEEENGKENVYKVALP
jgi:hypothetical protein